MKKLLSLLLILIFATATAQSITIKDQKGKVIFLEVPVEKIEETLNKLPNNIYIIEKWLPKENKVQQCKVIRRNKTFEV